MAESLSNHRSRSIPVGDGEDEKHLVVIVAGHPPDNWDQVNPQAMACMKEARDRVGITTGKPGRRGNFSTLATGVSYGGGQTRPMNFTNKGRRAKVLRDLNKQSCFRRIAGFQSCRRSQTWLTSKPY